MSAYKKGEEPYLRPYCAIIRAKMGFQRDSIPLEGVWGRSPHYNFFLLISLPSSFSFFGTKRSTSGKYSKLQVKLEIP